MLTRISISAYSVAPSAIIFGVAGDAETAVGMFSVGAEYVTFIKDNSSCVHVVIFIPNDGNIGTVLSDIGFVRILK